MADVIIAEPQASVDSVPSTKTGCKIVVRLLPSLMNESEFLSAVSPLPPHDYFYFVSAENSLEPHSFSRAYINITNEMDVLAFKESFDGYVFVDSQGNEYPAMVEFAPYQKIPKGKAKAGKRKDPKMGTIEGDPDFVRFREAMENPEKARTSRVMQPEQQLEEIEARERSGAKSTPLLDFIREKKAEKMRIREEKREVRRRKEEDRKRNREEERARRQKQQKTATSADQDLLSGKHRKEDRVFKSSINSKKRPEKRDRKSASKEESISEFGDLSSDSKRKQSSRERKEQMRLQKRSEIKERRQKDRKERYEKKKSEVMQEKKLPATVSKVPSNDTMVAEAEDEICDNIKPKRYSDRRREDKIKRENKIAAATGANPKPSTKSDEKLTDQLSNLSVNDNKTKIKSRTREEGSSKKNGSDNEGGQKRKEKHDVVEGGEERKITEEEKRRREEITARRDRERQERKERIKNKTRPEMQIYRVPPQRKREKETAGGDDSPKEEKREALDSAAAIVSRRGSGRGGRGAGRGGYLQSKGKGRRGGGVAQEETKSYVPPEI